MYNVVGLMSAQSVASQFGEFYNPRNPESPLRLYSDLASVTVDIRNITFIDAQVALVRFSRTVHRGSERTTSHWMATLSFTYLNAQMSAQDRLINPLGFQVTEYRVDPEIVRN